MNTTASRIQETPRNRHCGFRKTRISPDIQMGANTGLISRNWNGTTAHHGCELVEFPAAIDRDTAICGHPFAACQTSQGDHSRIAMTPAAYRYLLRNIERGPTAITETSSAIARNAGSGLLSSPTPSTTPAAATAVRCAA